MKDKKRQYKRWTKEEEFILKQYYGLIPIREIMKIINRSERAIVEKANRMNLKSKIRGRYPKFLKYINSNK